MTAKSVLVRPQGLRPRARAPTCPLLATPLPPPPRNPYKKALNVIRDLWCRKQTVYKVGESAFTLIFRQTDVRFCS